MELRDRPLPDELRSHLGSLKNGVNFRRAERWSNPVDRLVETNLQRQDTEHSNVALIDEAIRQLDDEESILSYRIDDFLI